MVASVNQTFRLQTGFEPVEDLYCFCVICGVTELVRILYLAVWPLKIFLIVNATGVLLKSSFKLLVS
jgi:hypothetical protein